MSQAPEKAVVLGEAGRIVMYDSEAGSKHKAIVIAPVKWLQRSSYCYRKDCKKERERGEKQTGDGRQGDNDSLLGDALTETRRFIKQS